MKQIGIILSFFISTVSFCQTKISAKSIEGMWMSTEENLEVQVYIIENEYKAKVIWFNDSDDKSKPMKTRCDFRNPEKMLRSRRIIGMDVLKGLRYNKEEEEWQNGRIYDPHSGKEWNAKIWLSNDGYLKVRGFWHFEILGQTLRFKRV